jgi:hypothetical protein
MTCLDWLPASYLAVAMTKMSLLSAMASAVIARNEAIQWTDNKQIEKHVIARSGAT